MLTDFKNHMKICIITQHVLKLQTDELLTSVLEVMVAMDIKMPIYFVPVGKKQDVVCYISNFNYEEQNLYFFINFLF